MGTAVVSAESAVEIMLPKVGEIVGDDSPFAIHRRELKKEYSGVIGSAAAIKEITSQEDAEKAVQHGRLLQVAQKETEAFFKVFKTRVDDIKKPILEAEKKDVGEIEAEKKRLGVLQAGWDAKVRKEREEADRKAHEEAERQAQEEMLQRAIEMEQAGELDMAEAALEEPVVALPVVTQVQSAPTIAGKVSRVNYSAEVVDLMALVRAVAAGKAPIQALQADLSFIKAQARSFKEGFSLPGCKLLKDDSVSYRS